MSDIKAIEFVAEVRQIKTMADGSVTVLLNMGEDCREQAKVFLDWHHSAVRGVLEILTDFDNETKKETEGNSPKVGRRRIGHRGN